ncbi:MAG: hypothetical protein Q9181_002779 [Wetmoreana brouardii]
MRLLETSSITLHEFQGDSIPEYAILSHTWGAGEVSYQVLLKPEAKYLAGYDKIKAFCSIAAAQGWKYGWVDTCCIDKTSSAELSEAINSMWRWYEKSAVCFAYLQDCTNDPDEGSRSNHVPQLLRNLTKSRWFTRGWTLQELLAPTKVVFYDYLWNEIGERDFLRDCIRNATGISPLHLRHPKRASIAAKMSWMSKRQTTRPEDIAYSLMGLFDVYMPLIYGEGANAFMRLQQEIVKSSNDESIFAWTDNSLIESGMFALSPDAFADSGDVVTLQDPDIRRSPYSVTNFGLAIEASLSTRYGGDDVPADASSLYTVMPIACTRGSEQYPLMISLVYSAGTCVRDEVGTLVSLGKTLRPCAGFHLIHVKPSYRRERFGPPNLSIEPRWDQIFEEYMTYSGLLPGDSVVEHRFRRRLVCSGYREETVQWRFHESIAIFSEKRQQHLELKGMVPIFLLEWKPNLVTGTGSWTIYVKKEGKHYLRSSNWRAGVLRSYHRVKIRNGCTTVPLWDGIRLQAQLKFSIEGNKVLALNLLVPSTMTKLPSRR